MSSFAVFLPCSMQYNLHTENLNIHPEHPLPSVADSVRKPPSAWKVSDLDIVVDPLPAAPQEAHMGPGVPSSVEGTSRECAGCLGRGTACLEPS